MNGDQALSEIFQKLNAKPTIISKEEEVVLLTLINEIDKAMDEVRRLAKEFELVSPLENARILSGHESWNDGMQMLMAKARTARNRKVH